MRPLKGLGIKIDVWENPVVYASTRDWSSLYGAIRSEPETAAQSSCSHFSLLLSVSGNTHAVSLLHALQWVQLLGRQRRILSPLSPSPLLLRVSIKKKKSMSPHDSQFIQANIRRPFKVPLDSAFDRLKMNSSRPSARYHIR